MDKIINYIKGQVKPVFMPPGKRLPGKVGNEYFCYLMSSGLAVVYNGNNPRPLGIVSGSSLLGLSQLLYPKGDFEVRIIHPSLIYTISAATLLAMINSNNQWFSLSSHLSEFVYFVSSRTEREKRIRTAELILQTLYLLQSESDEVRLAHTINDYLRDITGLSHSTIVRTVNTLKKQGKIEVQNGLLLRLNTSSSSGQA